MVEGQLYLFSKNGLDLSDKQIKIYQMVYRRPKIQKNCRIIVVQINGSIIFAFILWFRENFKVI